MVTSDFSHYLREGIENGIWKGDSLVTPGLGGIAMYVIGNVGGLMITSTDVGIECQMTLILVVDSRILANFLLSGQTGNYNRKTVDGSVEYYDKWWFTT